MFCARLFICALWSPAGKGLTSWLSFVVSSVSLSLSHWYPGSGVVLDCIDSWSLHHYLLLRADIYNSNCWQSVLATVKIHVNSRVGVFYPFFLTILATQRLLLPQIKVNRCQRTHARRKKGDYFENLRFIQILFETQQIFVQKNVICAKNATTNIRFFDVYRLTSNMFTIRTGNLFAILYTCWNKLRFIGFIHANRTSKEV